jgi:hypothetical protein
MQLQKLDPIFNMGVDVMRQAFNLEPKYRVTILTREEWNRGPETRPEVQGLLWYTDPERRRGLVLGSMGDHWEEGSVSL